MGDKKELDSFISDINENTDDFKPIESSMEDISSMKRKVEEYRLTLEPYRKNKETVALNVDEKSEEPIFDYEPPEALKHHRQRSLLVLQTVKEDKLLFEESIKRKQENLEKAKEIKEYMQKLNSKSMQLNHDSYQENEESLSPEEEILQLKDEIYKFKVKMCEQQKELESKNKLILELNTTIGELEEAQTHAAEKSEIERLRKEKSMKSIFEKLEQTQEHLHNELKVVRTKYLQVDNNLKCTEFSRNRLIQREAEIRRKLEILITENEQMKTDYKITKESLEKQHEEHNTISNMLENLKNENEWLRSEYEAIKQNKEEEKAVIIQKLNDVIEENEQLKLKFEQMKHRSCSEQDRGPNMCDELENLLKENESLKLEYAQMKQMAVQDKYIIDEIRDKLHNVTEDYGRLKLDYDQVKASKIDVCEKLDVLKKENVNLVHHNKQVVNDLLEVEICEKVYTLEQEKENIRIQFDEIRQRCDQGKLRADRLYARLKGIIKENEHLKRKCTTMEQDAAKKTDQIIKLEKESAHTMYKLEHIRRENEVLKSAYDQVNQMSIQDKEHTAQIMRENNELKSECTIGDEQRNKHSYAGLSGFENNCNTYKSEYEYDVKEEDMECKIDATNKLNHLSCEYEVLKSEYEQMKQKLIQNRQRTEEMHRKLIQFSDENELLDSNNQKLQKMLAIDKQHVNEILERLDATLNENEHLKFEYERISRESLENNTSSDMMSGLTENVQLKNDLEKTNEYNQKIGKQLQALRKKLTIVTRQNDQLKATIENLNTEINQCNGESSKAANVVQSHENMDTALSTKNGDGDWKNEPIPELADIFIIIQRLVLKLDNVIAENNGVPTDDVVLRQNEPVALKLGDISMIVTNVEKLENKLTDLMQCCTKVSGKLNNEQLGGLNRDITNLQKQNTEYQQQILKLKKLLTVLKGKLQAELKSSKELMQQLGIASEKISQLEEENKRLSDVVVGTEINNYKMLEKRCLELETLIENLQQVNDNKQQQINELNGQLEIYNKLHVEMSDMSRELIASFDSNISELRNNIVSDYTSVVTYCKMLENTNMKYKKTLQMFEDDIATLNRNIDELTADLERTKLDKQLLNEHNAGIIKDNEKLKEDIKDILLRNKQMVSFLVSNNVMMVTDDSDSDSRHNGSDSFSVFCFVNSNQVGYKIVTLRIHNFIVPAVPISMSSKKTQTMTQDIDDHLSDNDEYKKLPLLATFQSCVNMIKELAKRFQQNSELQDNELSLEDVRQFNQLHSMGKNAILSIAHILKSQLIANILRYDKYNEKKNMLHYETAPFKGNLINFIQLISTKLPETITHLLNLFEYVARRSLNDLNLENYRIKALPSDLTDSDNSSSVGLYIPDNYINSMHSFNTVVYNVAKAVLIDTKDICAILRMHYCITEEALIDAVSQTSETIAIPQEMNMYQDSEMQQISILKDDDELVKIDSLERYHVDELVLRLKFLTILIKRLSYENGALKSAISYLENQIIASDERATENIFAFVGLLSEWQLEVDINSNIPYITSGESVDDFINRISVSGVHNQLYLMENDTVVKTIMAADLNELSVIPENSISFLRNGWLAWIEHIEKNLESFKGFVKPYDLETLSTLDKNVTMPACDFLVMVKKSVHRLSADVCCKFLQYASPDIQNEICTEFYEISTWIDEVQRALLLIEQRNASVKSEVIISQNKITQSSAEHSISPFEQASTEFYANEIPNITNDIPEQSYDDSLHSILGNNSDILTSMSTVESCSISELEDNCFQNVDLSTDAGKLGNLANIQITNISEQDQKEIINSARTIKELKVVLKQSNDKIQSLMQEISLLKNREEYKIVKNLRSKLNYTLNELHQRDTHCDELARELSQLLGERDALQLRLSNVIGQNEKLRSKIGYGSEKVDNVEQQKDTFKPLERKMEELQSVSYLKDPKLSEESKLRHEVQMKLLTDTEDCTTEVSDMENGQGENDSEIQESSASFGISIAPIVNWFYGGTGNE